MPYLYGLDLPDRRGDKRIKKDAGGTVTKSCLVKSKRKIMKIFKYSALLAGVVLLTCILLYLFTPLDYWPRFLRRWDGQFWKAFYTRYANSSDPEKRKSGLSGLANHRRHYYFEPDYYTALRLLINDPHWSVRDRAALILSYPVQSPRGTGLNTTEIKIIVMALGMTLKNDPDRLVRLEAANGLSYGYLNETAGAEEAIKYLREVAADESLPGSKEAKIYLPKITAEER